MLLFTNLFNKQKYHILKNKDLVITLFYTRKEELREVYVEKNPHTHIQG